MKKYVLYFAILILPLRNIVEKIPNIYGIDGLGFMNVLFLLLVLLAYITRKEYVNTLEKKDYISLPLALYFLYFLVLVLVPLNSYANTWFRFIFWKDYLIGFCFYFIIIRFNLSRKDIIFCLIIMFIANVYMDSYFWRWVRWMNFASFDDRLKTVNGTFGKMGGPNEWAAFHSTYSLIIFSLARVFKNKKLKLSLYLLFFCNILVMLFSFSRGAYVGFSAGMIWYFWKEKNRLGLLFFVIILICYSTLLPDSVVERINMTQSSEGVLDSDAESRLVMWKYALEGINDNWFFGNGLLSFNFLYPESNVLFNNPHNHHLHLFYEGGIIAYILFLWLFIASYRQSILLYKKTKLPFEKALGLGSAASIVALFCVNFFGNRWSYMCLIGYFWVIMAFNSRLLQLEMMTGDSLDTPEGK